MGTWPFSGVIDLADMSVKRRFTDGPPRGEPPATLSISEVACADIRTPMHGGFRMKVIPVRPECATASRGL
jgi:hypothetical protein